MKKSLLLIIIFLNLLFCKSALAGYAIELKNGRIILTEKYWIEGDNVKFYFYGGITGFRKELIKEIKKANIPAEVKDEKKEKPAIEEIKKENKQEVKESKPEKKEFKKEEYYKNLREEIKTREKEIMADFNDPSVKGDKKKKQEIRKELFAIRDETRILKKEVMEFYKGTLPDWW